MALRLYKEEKQVVWSLRLLVVALRKQNRVSLPLSERLGDQIAVRQRKPFPYRESASS